MVAPHRRLLVLGLAATLAVLAGCSTATPRADTPCSWSVAGATHHEAQLGGVRLHYVTAGSGPPVLLLHGFPETAYAWRGVLPRLAAKHTVVAPDLRGIGCSSAERSGYDKQTMAADVHRLVARLGLGRVAVVGHDLGGMVAFAYARSYPRQVTHLAVSGAVLPGFGLGRLIDEARRGRGLTHLATFMRPHAADRISGHERKFLAGFIGSPAVVRGPAFDRYVRAYSRPGRLADALGQYRALPRDAADNRRGLRHRLRMPALAVGGGPEVTETAASLRRVAADVRAVRIPRAGHYAHEERPAAFAAAVGNFLRRG